MTRQRDITEEKCVRYMDNKAKGIVRLVDLGWWDVVVPQSCEPDAMQEGSTLFRMVSRNYGHRWRNCRTSCVVVIYWEDIAAYSKHGTLRVYLGVSGAYPNMVFRRQLTLSYT